MRKVLMVAVLLQAARPLCAQPNLAFEVASVRLAKTAPILGGQDPDAPPAAPPPPVIQPSANGLTMRNIDLNSCVEWAYSASHFQISAAAPLPDDKYDIVARAGRVVSEAELKLMLQTLLAERFHLKIHREQRQHTVSALVVDANGPKFHQSPAGSGDKASRENLVHPNDRWETRYRNVTMKEFARYVSFFAFGPVEDMTGLKDRYDLTLASTLHHGSPEALYEHLLSNLRNQLGLSLATRKGTIEMLIVDHVNQRPTPN